MNQRYGRAWISAGAMLAMAHVAMGVPVYDNMDTAANLVGWVWPTNYQPSTATANGDGTVTFTRVAFWDPIAQIYPDAGLDWMQAKISLTPDHGVLQVTPVSRDSGFYSVSVLYFDAAGNFLSEPYLAIDSSSLTPRSWTLAADATPPAQAASYFVRFRIQPPAEYADTIPVSVTFTDIDAVPEPVLAGAGAIATSLLLRRRRKA